MSPLRKVPVVSTTAAQESPRAAHGWALFPVEKPELDASRIGDPAHQPVHRVHLAHQVAFPQSADCRVAGHHSDGLAPVGDERRTGTQPRSRTGRFAAGVPTPDDDDVKLLCHGCLPDPRVSRESFADTKLRKDDVQQLLDIDGSGDPAQRNSRRPQIFCPKLRLPRL